MLTKELIQHFKTQGYTIVRNVLKSEDILNLSQACDQLCTMSKSFQSDHFKKVTFFKLQRDCNPFSKQATAAPIVKGKLKRVTYPYAVSETLNQYRVHPSLLNSVKELLGENIVQIVNQINFNHPGQKNGWGWHQDYRFRKEGLTNFPDSYVQSLIAIDKMTKSNGGVKFIPKSFLLGPLKLDQEQETAEEQFNALNAVTPELAPGDMVLFGPYTIHGSGSNTSQNQRRVFINGYANQDFCSYGMPVMKNGKIITKIQGEMEYESEQKVLSLASKR